MKFIPMGKGGLIPRGRGGLASSLGALFYSSALLMAATAAAFNADKVIESPDAALRRESRDTMDAYFQVRYSANAAKLLRIYDLSYDKSYPILDAEGKPLTRKYRAVTHDLYENGRYLFFWATHKRGIKFEFIPDLPYSDLRTTPQGGLLRLNSSFTPEQSADVICTLLSQAYNSEYRGTRQTQSYMTMQHNNVTRLSPEPAPK